ncbi:MAG: type-F conjugative transfer system secretin TraK [Rickettsiales bacterium]|nr:type-F conjugative transfer system secretin TraK [Rickettsiales bacterium]
MIVFLVLFLLFSKISFATEQRFVVKDRDAIIAVASKHELTHVVFEGDEVALVYCIGDQIEYVQDGRDLFLRIATDKPIVNSFVKTEAGFVYAMIFDLKDIPATQIFVTNSELERLQEEENKNSNLLLDSKIAQIIQFTKFPKEYLGYEFKQEEKELPPLGDLHQILDLEVEDEFLYAQKVILHNFGDKPIALNKRDFIDGWLAVHLGKDELKPDEETILILVAEKNEGEIQ